MNLLSSSQKNIFLADDDFDDRLLFEDALREVAQYTHLTTANDGKQLMDILRETVPPPPDVIFLDLNMPRKNGFECLREIKQTEKLKNIPIIIFSTTSQPDAVDKVYAQGAHFFVSKPGSFQQLKLLIQKILAIDWSQHYTQPSREKFLLVY